MGSTILETDSSRFTMMAVAGPSAPDEQSVIRRQVKTCGLPLPRFHAGVRRRRQQQCGLMRDALTGNAAAKFSEPEAAHA